MTYCNQKKYSQHVRVCLVLSDLKDSALNYWTEDIDGQNEFSALRALFKALESQNNTPVHQKQIEVLARSRTMKDLIKNKIVTPLLLLDFFVTIFLVGTNRFQKNAAPY